MAIFIGSKAEFKRYFDGYLKQMVASMTKEYKGEIKKKCQFCDEEKTELDAAHIKGKERATIIFNILDEKFKVNEDEYKVDIEEFSRIFKSKHIPIDENFYFLCKTCHRKYDNNEIKEEEMIEGIIRNLQKKLEEMKRKGE